MNTIEKMFLILLRLPLSAVIFCLFYYFVKQEINEYVHYGEVTQGVVTQKKLVSSSSTIPSPPYWEFEIRLSDEETILNTIEKKRAVFDNLKIGDTLVIKVINHSQGKIISYQGKEIHPVNSYLNIILIWSIVLIFVLFFGVYPWFQLYKFVLKRNNDE